MGGSVIDANAPGASPPHHGLSPRFSPAATAPVVSRPPIKAPRRKPAGRRAVGPSRSRFPPRDHHQPGPIRVHHRPAPGTCPDRRRDGGPLGHPAPDFRHPPTTNPPNPRPPSSQLGVSPCRVARTLAGGILPSARSMLARSRHPCLRFASNAGSTAQAHPSRTRIPRAKDAREAPRRKPAGRRAVGPSRSRFPPRPHHQPAQSASTTDQPREPAPAADGPSGHSGTASSR
jgi:hypothetical protein